MNQPELFDIVELLIDLPKSNLRAGTQGTIVECYGNNAYETELANSEGKTIALCTLSDQNFIIVWQAKTKSWLSLAEKITAIVNKLDTEKQAQVFQFVRSLPN